jgi:DNA-binding SARP family transcriptional activator
MQDILELDCELLPGWDDEWVVIERERLRQLRLLSLEAICDARSRAGDYGSAVEAGILAAGLEPLRESSHRALIRAHLAAGNYCEALRQYEDLYQHLVQQLSIKPSDATRRLLWPEG